MTVGPFGLVVSKGVPWSRKEWVLKRPPPWYRNRNALSGPQMRACLALAETATAAFGTKGKTPYKGVSMPSIAVKVAAACAGKSYGDATREERARRAHEAASASISSLRALAAQKGA